VGDLGEKPARDICPNFRQFEVMMATAEIHGEGGPGVPDARRQIGFGNRIECESLSVIVHPADDTAERQDHAASQLRAASAPLQGALMAERVLDGVHDLDDRRKSADSEPAFHPWLEAARDVAPSQFKAGGHLLSAPESGLRVGLQGESGVDDQSRKDADEGTLEHGVLVSLLRCRADLIRAAIRRWQSV
jgi:hypothetical protein